MKAVSKNFYSLVIKLIETKTCVCVCVCVCKNFTEMLIYAFYELWNESIV